MITVWHGGSEIPSRGSKGSRSMGDGSDGHRRDRCARRVFEVHADPATRDPAVDTAARGVRGDIAPQCRRSSDPCPVGAYVASVALPVRQRAVRTLETKGDVIARSRQL